MQRLQWASTAVEQGDADFKELAVQDASSRVLVGIAFYGHRHSDDRSAPEAITGPGYLDLLRAHHPAIKVNRNAKEHYFRFPSSGSDSLVCYYPTTWSIAARLKAIAKLGAGVSIWEVGQGLDYWFDLL